MKYLATIKYKSIDDLNKNKVEVHKFKSQQDRMNFINSIKQFSKEIILSEIREQ